MNSPVFSRDLGSIDGISRQRCRGRVAIFIALTAATAFASRPVRACSAANPEATPPTAIPRDGSTEVPTATSFVILSLAQPTDVALEAGGVAVPLDAPTSIGVGQDDTTNQAISFWQVKPSSGFLPPSAELVLSIANPKGGRTVLSTVHTAAGYDKQPATPAILKSLTLTRVRYPVAEIASGNCVFSEYLGYITFDASVAAIPGTPSASVVNTITLRPKNGGAAEQGRAFTGAKAYSGDPAGAFEPYSSAEWTPFLDPTLEYCAAITSFGFGDLARLPVTSNVVCAHVAQVSMPGAGDEVDGGSATDARGDAPDPAADPGAVRDPTADAGGRCRTFAGRQDREGRFGLLCRRRRFDSEPARARGPRGGILSAPRSSKWQVFRVARYHLGDRNAIAPKLTTLASSMFHCS